MADDLQQKIAQARLAMGGDKRHVSPDLLVNNLVGRRQSTLRLSDSDLTTNHGPVLSPNELEKRKLEARIAMESSEYKKRREAKEKADKESKIMAEKVLELKQARIEMEKKRGLDSKSKMVYDEEKRLRQEELYQKRLQTSKELIAELTSNAKSGADTYHTLSTDVNEQISSGKLTMAKIAMEEEARRRLATIPTRKSPAKNIFIGLGIMSFLVLGSIAVFFSLELTKPSVSTVKPLEIASLIFANQNQEFVLDNKTATEITTELKNKISNPALPPANIVNIYPTKKITIEGQELKTLATGRDLITALGLDVPANFTHFLLDKFMLGSIGGTNSINSPFVILKTRSFESTLDAMLRTENQIVPTLLNPLLTTSIYPNGSFSDQIISNIDARVGKNSLGEVIAVYGFFDQETLVITTNTQAFSNLLLAFQSR